MPRRGGIGQLGSATGVKFRQLVHYPEVGVSTVNKSFYLSSSSALGSEVTGNFNFIFDT